MDTLSAQYMYATREGVPTENLIDVIISNDALLYIIGHESLSWVIERYRKAGVKRFQKPLGIVDTCHLCCEIFSSEKDLEKLRPALVEYGRTPEIGRSKAGGEEV